MSLTVLLYTTNESNTTHRAFLSFDVRISTGYLDAIVSRTSTMCFVAFLRGWANDAQLTPPGCCFRGSVPKQMAQLTSSQASVRLPHAVTTTTPQLPRPIAAQISTSPLPTALVRLSHLPQHHNISFCLQNFDIHPHSSVPLRRLTHITFTCICLHRQPIATALHSLRVYTTSSQQPIRLAGDTRPPPA